MREVLLTILQETLDEVTEEMNLTNAAIEEYRAEMGSVEEELKRANRKQSCANYEADQAKQRAETLRRYLGELEQPSRMLTSKMKKLSDEHERTMKARDEADSRVAHVRSLLQEKQTQIAVDEKRYVELKTWWNEVSKLISDVQHAT